MSDTILPQQSVSTSLNLDKNRTLQMIDGRDSSISSRNDSSLSPISKFKGSPRIPRSKSAVTFGTVTAASSQPQIGTPTLPPALPAISNRSKQRPFRSILNNDKTSGITRQWVTREIAALEFLQMGIPMAREGSIVHEGWMRQSQTSDQYQERANINLKEESEENDEGKDDEIFPISPALLPLHRSHNSPDPTVARQGRWWEKWIVGQNASGQTNLPKEQQSKGVTISRDSQIEDLEEPDMPEQQQSQSQTPQPNETTPQQQEQQPTIPSTAPATIYAPGRRLEGDPATKVQIPLANTLQNVQEGPGIGIGSTHQRQNSDVVSLQLTKHQSIARMAISREWELRVAHGLNERRHDHVSQQTRQQNQNPAMLDGRMYMSAKESYPMMVFSLIRYEPKKEEALRRRQKLEERGGGGTQFFIMPSRDWRGISFRALLPVTKHKEDVLQTTNCRDGIMGETDRDESGSTIEKGRDTNMYNSRLLFDRFAAKKSGSKDNFEDADAEEDGEGTHFGAKDSNTDEEDMDIDLDSDDEEEMGDDTYVVGLLDDPGMVQGRHRNVMIGDRGTGPIVSSTIQFVKPKLLKADLNQQFRERFDGYEPPISQRKFIGAKVVDGMYTLMDPTKDKGMDEDDGSTSRKIEEENDASTEATTIATVGTPTTGVTSNNSRNHRRRVGSTSSMSLSTNASIDGGTGEGQETIRMPPSLTLSKIRSLKRQALAAAVRAKLEISTVALAIIYFERLCLDCRVDKSNRRLSFAACLLLAIKVNEAHVGVITTKAVSNPSSSKKSRASQKIQSLIRPSKKSSTMFASLLEFFTQEWNISLKHLFAAEWGVFAALQFRLKAKPSDVAFHFRRLMKTLGYDPRRYLGSQVYGYWQQALAEEEFRRQEWETRVEAKRERKEKKKLKQLQREIDEAADRQGDHLIDGESVGEKNDDMDKADTNNAIDEQIEMEPQSPMNTITRRRLGLGDIFKTRTAAGNTAGGLQRRSVSIERSWTKRRSSGDTLSSSIKNAPAPTLAASRQRPRPPLLRPLSQSKSMLSLSAKGGIDEALERKNSDVQLGDLNEESGVAQHMDMVVDEEEGIVI